MKLKKIILFSAIALLLSAMIGCEEAEEKNWKKLPPATEKGKNTIGCLVDGKLWATNYWGLAHIMYSNISARFYKKGRKIMVKDSMYVEIYAQKENRSSMSLTITTPNIETWTKLEGEFDIDDFTSEDPYIYLTKFDTINHIISGRFFGKAINENKTDTVKITDGRFDIRCYTADY